MEVTGSMLVHREPEVYLVGSSRVRDDGAQEFLDDHNVGEWTTDADTSGEFLPEMAGRLCYMSFSKPRPGGNKAYLGHILEVGHGSVTEHATWNFIFTHISRSLSHELVRHRTGVGYSQLSQRYVDESVAEYVEPDVIANDQELHDLWVRTVATAHEGYKRLCDKLSEKLKNSGLQGTELRKTARQAARSVLPNATETKIFVTANARALRHMIEQRCSRHADTEIRKLFGKVWEIMVVEAPNLFSDYTKVDLPDGTFELTTLHRKV